MRWLSMSVVFRRHNSARRMPVEYSVISMVWWNRLLAESISRRYLIWAEDLRQLSMPFGIRNIFNRIAPLQSLDEEETEGGHVLLYRARTQLLVLKQVGLILARMCSGPSWSGGWWKYWAKSCTTRR